MIGNNSSEGVFTMISRKLFVTFGMVAIPIAMYTATEDNDIHFNQLYMKTIATSDLRICAHCYKEVASEPEFRRNDRPHGVL